MIISGDDAKLYRAVRLDTYADVNHGELVSANEDTGEVHWAVMIDGVASQKSETLGPNAIRIVRAGR